MEARREEQTVQIPLGTYFSSVSRSFVGEITFDVNGSVVQGEHSLTVTGIQFLR